MREASNAGRQPGCRGDPQVGTLVSFSILISLGLILCRCEGLETLTTAGLATSATSRQSWMIVQLLKLKVPLVSGKFYLFLPQYLDWINLSGAQRRQIHGGQCHQQENRCRNAIDHRIEAHRWQ